MNRSAEVDLLLHETRWLGGLARQLVGHPDDAADVTQDAALTALQRRPQSAAALPAWLRAVVRNRSRDVLRARRSRSVAQGELRERDVRHAPATDDVVAKAEVHELLVRAVLEMDEPYRTTLLLRFFENVPPREIAKRQGVPVATVHSRLQRALARLRQRFLREHGSDWPLALAPLLPRWSLASFLLGLSIMKLVLISCAAVVTVVVAVALFSGDPDAAPLQVGATDASPEGPGGAVSAGRVDAPGSVREVVESSGASARDTAEVAAAVAMRAGRVIDVRGAGVVGVALDSGVGPSDGSGSFEFPVDLGADRVRANDPRWSTVLAGSTRTEADSVSMVVVAPRIELHGRVVDEAGLPIADAAVSVHLPSHLGADLDILLDHSIAQVWRAKSDRDGRFELGDVPAVANGALVAELGGYLPTIEALPQATNRLLELVLSTPDEASDVVRGIVVDPNGVSVADARVSAGQAISRSDERGEFAVDLNASDGRNLGRLVAVAPGMQPAVFEPECGSDGQPLWPARVVLRLGPAPLSIRGIVTDGAGRPAAGARVWIADPMVLGVDGDVVLAETTRASEPRPFWAYVTTDAAGSFHLDGLLDRDYVVRALDPETLVAATIDGVRAGTTGLTIRLEEATHPALRGRVVARDGAPMPGVHVTVQRPALEVKVAGGTRDEWVPRDRVTTAEDGSFEFENVPQSGVEVFAIGDSIQFAGRMVEPGSDATDFVVEVDRRVHLQIELTAPKDRADRLRVLGANGRSMLLRVMRGEAAYTNRSAKILDGRTEVLSLGEGAATAVFYRGEDEVGRLPLSLRWDRVNRVVF